MSANPKTKKGARRTDGVMSPEELDKAIQAYKTRRAMRLAAKCDEEGDVKPEDAPAAAAAPDMTAGLGMIAAALSVGIAGVGGGIAVAAAAPAAIGATSEDPKAFGKAIIFVALGEGIALYGLLISILILQKF